MTATATLEPLTDAKGTEVAVRYFVKTADFPKAEVTRLERKSKRLVLRVPTEDGGTKLIARRAARVTVLKNHGRIVQAKAPKATAKAGKGKAAAKA